MVLDTEKSRHGLLIGYKMLKIIIYYSFIRIGPLRTHWCMRFEAKHHFFKQAMARKSFKNVPMTMAWHHQYSICHQLILNEAQHASNFLYTGDTHLIGKIFCISFNP